MTGFVYPKDLDEMDIETFMNYVSLAVVYKHNYIFKNIDDMINTLINKCHVDQNFARQEIFNIISSCYNNETEQEMINILKQQIKSKTLNIR